MKKSLKKGLKLEEKGKSEYPQNKTELSKFLDKVKDFSRNHFRPNNEKYTVYKDSIYNLSALALDFYKKNKKGKVVSLLKQIKKLFHNFRTSVNEERFDEKMLNISAEMSKGKRKKKTQEIINLIKIKVEKTESPDKKIEMQSKLEIFSRDTERAFNNDDVESEFRCFSDLLQLLIIEPEDYKEHKRRMAEEKLTGVEN